MKILAIRGRNLASLESFALELDQPPLATAGLFAIVGPTGAGKSTLLDALCLALYDRTPRSEGAPEQRISDDLNSQDPRTVMRRGASEAFAEVDFIGQGGRFRARWEVWRAKRRGDGNLQPQRILLWSLDQNTELTGATKTETLAAIAAAVGLSFGEFRRAVLLAQGDFAAFLDARPEDRAELLEKMTGTEIYSRLSRGAFLRAKSEQQTLEVLQARRLSINPLPPETAAQLADAQLRFSKRRTELEAELVVLEQTLAWHQTASRLTQERLAAEEALALAEAEREATAPLAAEVAQTEAAVRFQPLHQAVQRTATLLESRRAKVIAAQSESFQREEAAAAAQAQLQVAQEAEDALRSQWAALEPILAEARRTDELLRLAEAEALAAKEAAGEHQRRLTELEVERRKVETTLESLRNSYLEAEAAKIATEWVAPLAHERGRWEALIAGLAQERVQARELVESSTKTEALWQNAEKARDHALAVLAQVDAALAEQRSQAEAAQEALEAHRRLTEDQREEALVLLARELSSLQAMAERAREVTALEKRLAQDQRGQEQDRLRSKELRVRHKKLRARNKKLIAELTERQDSARLLGALAVVHSHRESLLIPNQACPLCGALEHPALGSPQTPDREAARAERRLLRLQKRIDQNRDGARQALQEAENLDKGAKEQALRIERLEQELREKEQEWGRRRDTLAQIWLDSGLLAKHGVHKLALSLPDLAASEAKVHGVEKVELQLLQLKRILEEHGRAEVELGQHAAETRRGLDRVLDQRVQAERALAQAQRLADQRQAEHAQITPQRAAQQARLEELERTLVAVLGPIEDPSLTLQRVQAGLAARAAAQSALSHLGEKKAEAERDNLRLLTEHAGRTEQLIASKKEVAAREAMVVHLRKARGALLNGDPTEVVAKAAEARRQASQLGLNAAQNALSNAETRKALAAAELVAAQAQTLETEAQHEQALQQLREATSGTPFTDATVLEVYLRRDSAWLEETREHLAALNRRVVQLQTLAQDRAARWAAHHLNATPPGDLLSVTQTREKLRGEVRQLTEELGRLEGRLEADREAQLQVQQLEPQLLRQKQSVAAWAELAQVIGSSDGKKLRTFAQRYTMQILLEYANLHLKRLRPRYALEPTSQDMQLVVVDRDLGDERRTLSTLSGGERFLVALALALGLSSLSAGNVRLGSLFIDEGFGALDRDALEIAVAALDELQAEGRAIGIISHVPDLADRLGVMVEVRPVGPGKSEVYWATPQQLKAAPIVAPQASLF